MDRKLAWHQSSTGWLAPDWWCRDHPPAFAAADFRDRTDVFRGVPYAPTWLVGFIPLLAVNWRARTAPDRDMRLHVSLALSCGLAAGVIALVLRAEPLAAIAMASGAAFAAQMLSPFHRLSGVQDSRNPVAQRYRSAEKRKDAVKAHPISASLVKAKREIEDVAAGFRDPSGSPDQAPATAELVDEDDEPQPSPHNQVTILLLNLIYLMFPVVGGLHRLAVGRVISGLIWMVTGGLFFVGQIYDAYMIITGQFLDSEGRPVGPYQKREATTPVNHLSGIPAAIKPTHPGAFALNSIGIACVFVGCGLVLASLVVTGLVTFADHRAFIDMSESMGSSRLARGNSSDRDHRSLRRTSHRRSQLHVRSTATFSVTCLTGPLWMLLHRGGIRLHVGRCRRR